MMAVATIKDRVIESLTWNGAKSVVDLSDELQVQLPYIRRAIAMLMEEGLVEGTLDRKVQAVRNG